MSRKLLLTCEHGGNRVPAAYRHLFGDAVQALASHRGHDPGALELARAVRRRLHREQVPSELFHATVTRLLVELNRSLHHRQLFSEFTARLDRQQRTRLVERYYLPYRQRVHDWIARQVQSGYPVLHVSVHSFTPVWRDQERRADIGLLYDPRRTTERQLCGRWRDELVRLRPDCRVRRNYPYLGKADGFTTFLRRHFPDEHYVGIELEVSQNWVFRPETAETTARSLMTLLR